jgi:hypothetical protein
VTRPDDLAGQLYRLQTGGAEPTAAALQIGNRDEVFIDDQYLDVWVPQWANAPVHVMNCRTARSALSRL